MKNQSSREVPWQVEIGSFRTLNVRDSPANLKDDEMTICINLQPIGTSLFTIPGLVATVDDSYTIGKNLTQWSGSAPVVTGDVRIPYLSAPEKWTGFCYVAESNGTTGLTEPVWPTTGNTTVVDNEVTWRSRSLRIRRAISFNWAGVPYLIVATNGGSLHKINVSATPFVQEMIAPPGTVSNPRFAAWKDTRVLIVDPTAGYTTYNGTTLSAFDPTLTATAIAVFNTRVWIANGRTIKYTGPDLSNAAGFSATGSGSVVDNYASLSVGITALVATQEYLYVIGDHAVHLIHGVTLLDTGATAFQINDAIKGVGTNYPDTVIAYRGYIYLFGEHGAYAIQGQNDANISSYIDKLFLRADFSFEPISFLAKINFKVCYCTLFLMSDPVDGTARKYLWVVYEDRWFLVNFGDDYNMVGGVTVEASDNMTSYIFDYDTILSAFVEYSTMRRKFRTKAFNFGRPLHDKVVTRIGCQLEPIYSSMLPLLVILSIYFPGGLASARGVLEPFNLVWLNADGDAVLWNNIDNNVTDWAYPFSEVLTKTTIEGRGKRIQVDFEEQSSSAYVVNQLQLEGIEGADW